MKKITTVMKKRIFSTISVLLIVLMSVMASALTVTTQSGNIKANSATLTAVSNFETINVTLFRLSKLSDFSTTELTYVISDYGVSQVLGLADLDSNTLYYYEFSGGNSTGTQYEINSTFTTSSYYGGASMFSNVISLVIVALLIFTGLFGLGKDYSVTGIIRSAIFAIIGSIIVGALFIL